MQGICRLAQDINSCPHYQADTIGCAANNTVCCFYSDPGARKEVRTDCVRKPRWYERYYQKR